MWWPAGATCPLSVVRRATWDAFDLCCARQLFRVGTYGLCANPTHGAGRRTKGNAVTEARSTAKSAIAARVDTLLEPSARFPLYVALFALGYYLTARFGL